MRQHLIALLFAALLTCPGIAHGNEPEFFYYGPELASGNLSLLKQTAESYLREAGIAVNFQPFARIEDLEAEFEKRRPQFLLVPDWVIASRCFGAELAPLVQPVRDGRLVDRRALMAGRTVVEISQLDHGAIATTVIDVGAEGPASALQRFRADHPDARLIPVPKDVDALLAVSFGQVDAAFVSTAQFERLARVNPTLTGALHELGYSDETPLPRVYATGFASRESAAAVADALERSASVASGRRLTSLLGYDQWMAIEHDEASTTTYVTGCTADGEVTR